jgi:hypothetical protein
MSSSYTSIFDDPNFNIVELIQQINDEVGPEQAQQVQAIYTAAQQQQGNSPPGSPGANVTSNAPSPGSHKGGRKTIRKYKKRRRKRKTKKRRQRRRRKRR